MCAYFWFAYGGRVLAKSPLPPAWLSIHGDTGMIDANQPLAPVRPRCHVQAPIIGP